MREELLIPKKIWKSLVNWKNEKKYEKYLSLVPYHWWLYEKMQEQSFILWLQYYNCEVENFVFANVEKESNNMLSRPLQCCKEPFTNFCNPDFVLVQEKN